VRPPARFALLVIVAFLASTRPALGGSSWASPVPIAPPLLGYGATYAFGDAMRTHSGVDLAADTGETVRAVADATVAFAGAVPDAGGGTALAVTLDFGDGLSATFMPFARMDVAKGASVVQGDRLGDVAGSGDASSATPHLHVGVTLNGARVDPASLLPASTPPADQQHAPSGDSAPSPAGAALTETPNAQIPAAVSPPAHALAPVHAAVSSPVASPRTVPVVPTPAAQVPAEAPAATHAAVSAIPAATATSLATRASIAAVRGTAALTAPDASSLLPMAAQMAVAQERAVSPTRLPDVSAIRVVRGIALRVVLGLAGTLASAIGIVRLAHVRRLVPAAVPASSR